MLTTTPGAPKRAPEAHEGTFRLHDARGVVCARSGSVFVRSADGTALWCCSRFLELDHITQWAMGGVSTCRRIFGCAVGPNPSARRQLLRRGRTSPERLSIPRKRARDPCPLPLHSPPKGGGGGSPRALARFSSLPLITDDPSVLRLTHTKHSAARWCSLLDDARLV